MSPYGTLVLPLFGGHLQALSALQFRCPPNKGKTNVPIGDIGMPADVSRPQHQMEKSLVPFGGLCFQLHMAFAIIIL